MWKKEKSRKSKQQHCCAHSAYRCEMKVWLESDRYPVLSYASCTLGLDLPHQQRAMTRARDVPSSSWLALRYIHDHTHGLWAGAGNVEVRAELQKSCRENGATTYTTTPVRSVRVCSGRKRMRLPIFTPRQQNRPKMVHEFQQTATAQGNDR